METRLQEGTSLWILKIIKNYDRSIAERERKKERREDKGWEERRREGGKSPLC